MRAHFEPERVAWRVLLKCEFSFGSLSEVRNPGLPEKLVQHGMYDAKRGSVVHGRGYHIFTYIYMYIYIYIHTHTPALPPSLSVGRSVAVRVSSSVSKSPGNGHAPRLGAEVCTQPTCRGSLF